MWSRRIARDYDAFRANEKPSRLARDEEFK